MPVGDIAVASGVERDTGPAPDGGDDAVRELEDGAGVCHVEVSRGVDGQAGAVCRQGCGVSVRDLEQARVHAIGHVNVTGRVRGHTAWSVAGGTGDGSDYAAGDFADAEVVDVRDI